MAINPGNCAACGFTGDVHEHHLVPKVRGGLTLPTVYLCPPCHGVVHKKKWDTRITTLTRAGIAKAKAEGRVGGNPGLRAGDPEAIRRMKEARAATHLAKITKSLGAWLPIVQKMRPKAAWVDVAAAVSASARKTWTEERLRRVMRRLVAEGMADKALMGEPKLPNPPKTPRRILAKETAGEIIHMMAERRAKREARTLAARQAHAAAGARRQAERQTETPDEARARIIAAKERHEAARDARLAKAEQRQARPSERQAQRLAAEAQHGAAREAAELRRQQEAEAKAIERSKRAKVRAKLEHIEAEHRAMVAKRRAKHEAAKEQRRQKARELLLAREAARSTMPALEESAA